jgi:hypothetical protein
MYDPAQRRLIGKNRYSGGNPEAGMQNEGKCGKSEKEKVRLRKANRTYASSYKIYDKGMTQNF